jgi:hypothetical protein
MREAKGDAWELAKLQIDKRLRVLCLTTNGFVKQDGRAVMGRGIAAEAKKRFPQLPTLLGAFIRAHGNTLHMLGYWGGEYLLCSFPVKHHWRENADLELIRQSAEALAGMAHNELALCEIYLPRPGCGNGKLRWKDVKPVIEFLPDNVIVIDR